MITRRAPPKQVENFTVSTETKTHGTLVSFNPDWECGGVADSVIALWFAVF
jgi:hypothetical protein